MFEYSCEVWDNCSQTARIVTGLTVLSSRDSLYQETEGGNYPVDDNAESYAKMNNMYHGQAPSYLCDLLPLLFATLPTTLSKTEMTMN